MSLVTYANRKNTDSVKWDGLTEMYGEENLLPLWVADMDFEAPACVTKAVTDYASKGIYGYYRVPDSYYDAFIAWEKAHHNYEVQKDWIRFSPGVVSAFNWIVQFMTQPADSVIVLTPVYYPFFHAVNNNNRKLIHSELVNTNGTYSIDYEDFEQKIIEHNVKLFILCSPHNPVGRVWNKEELKTLFDICRKHHVFVISDEIHHDIVFEGHSHTPSFTVGDYDDMMITLTAPSKTFNLAGCQNSVIIIPNEGLREKWDTFVNQIHILSGNPFGYIAATAAYRDGFAWFQEVKEIIYGNYLYMKERFASALPHIVVSPLEGTYLSWIDLKAYLSAEEMEDFMQKKCGLAFDYGNWFGGDSYGTFIRMNLATSRENVEKAVEAIIENLK